MPMSRPSASTCWKRCKPICPPCRLRNGCIASMATISTSSPGLPICCAGGSPGSGLAGRFDPPGGVSVPPGGRLGFHLLQTKALTLVDVPALLTLVQAENESVRPEMITWLREKLTALGPTEPAWVLEFLDSKHADVRLAGWNWLRESAVKTDTHIWHKLMESPYNDVRGWLTEMLSEIMAGTDTDTLRFLWATVLCSIQRGGRQKPGIVAQIVVRITKDTTEASKLLPLLAVAVRLAAWTGVPGRADRRGHAERNQTGAGAVDPAAVPRIDSLNHERGCGGNRLGRDRKL